MMHKTYLSRAMTRAMAIDHPIGDPFGGPAYGERRDPISAIVSISAMAGTYAAAGGFAAMTLMQGVAFAGAALSLVGNVTGNRTISKIGMVAGLAGGVGMLAESFTGQAIGGTLGETFGAGAQASSGAAAPLSQTPTAAPPATPAGVEITPVRAPGMAPASMAAPSAGPSAAQMVSQANATNMPMESLLQQLGEPVAPELVNQIRPLTVGERLVQGAKDVGSGVMSMSKNNPAAALMLGNAVGSVADWLSGKTDAEIDALRSQVGFADARAQQIQEEIEREKRRRANLNAGYLQVNPNVQVDMNRGVTPPGGAAPAAMPAAGMPASGMPMPIPQQFAQQPQAAMAMQQMAQQRAAMARPPGLIAGARG